MIDLAKLVLFFNLPAAVYRSLCHSVSEIDPNQTVRFLNHLKSQFSFTHTAPNWTYFHLKDAPSVVVFHSEHHLSFLGIEGGHQWFAPGNGLTTDRHFLNDCYRITKDQFFLAVNRAFKIKFDA
jgi:hypothetical protein